MRTEEADSLVPGPHLLDEQDRCAGCGQELRDGQALVALDPLAPCCCPGPPRLPPRARVPAVGSPGDLSKSIINILDSFQLNSNFHKPEWSFICPDSGDVIIKD